MLQNTAKVLVTKGRDLLNGFFNGIKKVWEEVTKFFRQIPSNVVKFVGNVAMTLLNKGKDLIKGLLNGIQNA